MPTLNRTAIALLVLCGLRATAQQPQRIQLPLLRILGGLRASTTERVDLPRPRVSGVIEPLPIVQAAERLAAIIGVPVLVRPGELGPAQLEARPEGPLRFQDRPVSDALREFCRSYRCSLVRGYPSGLVVSASPLPAGPAVQADGFAVSVASLRSYAYWSAVPGGRDSHRESLSVTLGVRVDLEHGTEARLHRLDSLRVTDDRGHTSVARIADSPLSGRLVASPIPDEYVLTVTLPWEPQSPRRITGVEGELRLYRRLEPVEIRAPIPEKDGAGEPGMQGGFSVQVKEASHTPNGALRAIVRIESPVETGVAAAPPGRKPSLELAEGAGPAVSVRRLGLTYARDHVAAEFLATAEAVPTRPAALRFWVVRQSEPTHRVPFRFTAFPGDLGEPSQGRAVDAAPGGSPLKPRPGDRLRLRVTSVTQSETRTLIPGHPVSIARSQTLRMACRPTAGPAQAIAGVDRLRVTPVGGAPIDAPPGNLSALSSTDPGEVVLNLSLPATGPLASGLERIDGSVRLYPGVVTERWSIPLPDPLPQLPLERRVGPATARLTRLELKPGTQAGEVLISGTTTLEWPDPGRMIPSGYRDTRSLAHLPDGAAKPVFSTSLRSSSVPLLETRGLSATLPTRPRALELLVPFRAGEPVGVPFTLRGVLMPIGRPVTLPPGG